MADEKGLPKPDTNVGGYLVGEKNGKTILHEDGEKGGLLIGKRHRDGGIQAVNNATGQPLEVETLELSITPKAAQDTSKFNFQGKEMTSKEVLSAINTGGGGVPILQSGGQVQDQRQNKPLQYKGGEMIITRPAVLDNKKRMFEGKMRTNIEIASFINEKNGGLAFSEKDIPNSVKTNGASYELGGKLTPDHEILSSCGCKHAQQAAMAKGGDVTDYWFVSGPYGSLLHNKEGYTGISVSRNTTDGKYFASAQQDSRWYQDFQPAEFDTIGEAKKWALREASYKYAAGGSVDEIQGYINENYPDKDLTDGQFIGMVFAVFSTQLKNRGMNSTDIQRMMEQAVAQREQAEVESKEDGGAVSSNAIAKGDFVTLKKAPNVSGRVEFVDNAAGSAYVKFDDGADGIYPVDMLALKMGIPAALSEEEILPKLWNSFNIFERSNLLQGYNISKYYPNAYKYVHNEFHNIPTALQDEIKTRFSKQREITDKEKEEIMQAVDNVETQYAMEEDEKQTMFDEFFPHFWNILTSDQRMKVLTDYKIGNLLTRQVNSGKQYEDVGTATKKEMVLAFTDNPFSENMPKRMNQDREKELQAIGLRSWTGEDERRPFNEFFPAEWDRIRESARLQMLEKWGIETYPSRVIYSKQRWDDLPFHLTRTIKGIVSKERNLPEPEKSASSIPDSNTYAFDKELGRIWNTFTVQERYNFLNSENFPLAYKDTEYEDLPKAFKMQLERKYSDRGKLSPVYAKKIIEAAREDDEYGIVDSLEWVDETNYVRDNKDKVLPNTETRFTLVIKYEGDMRLNLLSVVKWHNDDYIESNWVNRAYFQKPPYMRGDKFNKEEIKNEVIRLLKRKALASIVADGVKSTALKMLKIVDTSDSRATQPQGNPAPAQKIPLTLSDRFPKLWNKLDSQAKADSLQNYALLWDVISTDERRELLEQWGIEGNESIFKYSNEKWDDLPFHITNTIKKFLLAQQPKSAPEQKTSRRLKLSDIPASVKDFMPEHQQRAIVGSEEHWEIIDQFKDIIAKMPKTYETDNIKKADKMVWLRYFYGDSQWLIIEKDMEPEQLQAFGYVVLHDDEENGELGYINIEELKRTNKVELDFFFEPTKLGEILDESEPQDNSEMKTEEQPTTSQQKALLLTPWDRLPKLWSTYSAQEKGNLLQAYALLWDTLSFDKRGDLLERWDIGPSQKARNAYSEQPWDDLPRPVIQAIKKSIYEESGFPEPMNYLSPAVTEPPVSPEVITPATVSTDMAVPATAVGAKAQYKINVAIKDLIKEKGANRELYSADEIAMLKLWEGSGSLAKQGAKGTGLLDQFFTPADLVSKMWGLAIKHGFVFNGANVLEPAIGVGRFLANIPKDVPVNVVGYDIDPVATTICKLLYPQYDIRLGSFESMFFIGKRHVGLAGLKQPFDLVITNPPYRPYVSEFSPLGEKAATGAETFEMYFIMRGIDVLRKGGLLVMIVPNTFMHNDNKYNDFKETLWKKADLIDAYRLPNDVFPNTSVGTDIIVLRKK